MMSIAYLLNLPGDDIPYNPLFHAYLFVKRDQSVLFVDMTNAYAHVAEYKC